MEHCFEAALHLSQSNRRAVFHLYNSANRDLLERSLMQICEYVVAQFVDHAAEGRPIRPEDRQSIIRSYSCECFGHVIDWLNRGMRDDVAESFRRLCELRRGSTEIMLQRSAIV